MKTTNARFTSCDGAMFYNIFDIPICDDGSMDMGYVESELAEYNVTLEDIANDSQDIDDDGDLL